MKKENLLLLLIITVCILGFSVPSSLFAAGNTDKVSEISKSLKSKTAKATSSLTKSIPKNININSATKETLTLLPGIGPVKADAILKFKKEHGKFKSIDDLSKIKGIGEKTLAKLKPYLKKI